MASKSSPTARLLSSMDRFFEVHERGSTISCEFRAGVTTFVTMAYILFVNPVILGAAIVPEGGGDYKPQLMAATAIAAAFGTLVMGLLSKHPFALAPGMGLNAYFAYTVVLGQGMAWETALGAVFLSGLLFLVISAAGIRKALIDAIPRSLKHATTAGIGGFLAFIGLKNGGLVVDHDVTLVTLGSFSDANAVLTLAGLILTMILAGMQIRGAILLGIVLISGAAIVLQLPVFQGQAFAGFAFDGWQTPTPGPLLGALDIQGALQMGALGIVFTFLFVDFFDSAGTLIALSEKAGTIDEHGNMLHAGPAFSADALATSVGALLGTSSTTSYIESAAGVGEGGRTGLVSVIVALLFLASLFFWPLIAAVPTAATAPALVIVGAMMMFTASRISWDDPLTSVPCLLIILGMPLTFSITNGLALGLVTWCLAHVFAGRIKSVHPLMILLTLLLLARFIFLLEA